MMATTTATMSTTKLADLLVPFAEAANVRVRDVPSTLRLRIVLGLPFADTQALHASLFGGDAAKILLTTMDWPQARAFLAETACSTDEWQQLIGLLLFLNEPSTRPAVAEMIAAASAGLRVVDNNNTLTPIESMQLCFARAGIIPTWDLLCKSLLCANLADVDVRQAIEQQLHAAALPKSKRGGNNTKSNASIAETVVRHLPTYKHSRDEYTRAFAHILAHDNCHVAAHHVLRALKARDETLARVKREALAVYQGAQKPSLTRLLLSQPSAADEADEAVSDSSSSSSTKMQLSAMTFQRFCRVARLPVSANARVLQACYYFACLPDESTRADAYSRMFARDEQQLQQGAFPHCAVPEIAPLQAFVMSMQHFGEPCAALHQFRQQQQQQNGGGANNMTTIIRPSWTTVLRLFLAAQCPGLWTPIVGTLPLGQQHALGIAPPPLPQFPVAELLPFFTAQEE